MCPKDNVRYKYNKTDEKFEPIVFVKKDQKEIILNNEVKTIIKQPEIDSKI